MTEEKEPPVESAEAYRDLWKPEEIICPSGLKVSMRYLDPIEHMLLYVDQDKVAEYERRSLPEITKESAKKVKEDERKAQIKLLSTIIVKPKITEEKANKEELGFDEISLSDRRWLVNHAMNHIGFAGRTTELRKFRNLFKVKRHHRHSSPKILAEAKRTAGSKP